jgi:K+ transporter
VHGGWFPLAIAGAIFLLMMTWRDGRALLHSALQNTALTSPTSWRRCSPRRPRGWPARRCS